MNVSYKGNDYFVYWKYENVLNTENNRHHSGIKVSCYLKKNRKDVLFTSVIFSADPDSKIMTWCLPKKYLRMQTLLALFDVMELDREGRKIFGDAYHNRSKK